MVGKTISHYKVLEKIGEGGMGVVYRATDTKLNRDVALKILPEQFASDSQRMGRFQREAEVLASLDHPNIGQIYGIEEAGQTKALVLQLIEGPTLADKIAQGPIPVEDALKIALQMAEGLEAAHEKGVIPRDLKPANIKITPEGQVKILDFGLAKALEAEAPDPSLSQSPTLTNAATQAGVILGTAAYMSPEQARGKPVDKRADIFAFGAVLYECLTGKRAFEGEDVSDTLAGILAREPEFEALPTNIDPRILDLLERCLEKDARNRWHDIADVRVDIEKILASPIAVVAHGYGKAQPTWRSALALALAAGVIGALTGWFLRSAPNPGPVTRLSMAIPPGEKLVAAYYDSTIAISPDGGNVAYSTTVDGVSQIFLRRLDSLKTRPISGTESLDSVVPFFDPNGFWLGFADEDRIYKIPIDGGERQVVCECLANLRGVSWGPDNTIVFSPGVNTSGIWQISADGGTEEPLTTLAPGEVSHRWPQLLDGGQLLLFTAGRESDWDVSKIVAQRLGTDEPPVNLVREATYGRYLPTGHLIYFRGETLMARPLDLDRLEFTGPEVRLIEGISQHAGSGAPLVGFSSTGSLVYVEKSVGDLIQASSPVWVNRSGEVEPLGAPFRSYNFHDLSPNGQRVALSVQGPAGGIWIYDIDSGNLSPFVTRPARGSFPVWLAEDRISFQDRGLSRRASLSWKSVDVGSGSGPLSTSTNSINPTSVSPDGTWLTYTESDPNSADGGNIWVVPITDDGSPGEAKPFIQTPNFEGGGRISPDGKWMAYTSNVGGQYEVYVKPFPENGPEKQISIDGGEQPVWGPSGRELFYLMGDQTKTLMSVGISLDQTFRVLRSPTALFDVESIEDVAPPVTSMYDVSPDGQRFTFVQRREPPTEPTPLVVVQNWFEELKERVPVP